MNRAQRRRLGLPNPPQADSRIVYGARCVWRDSIANAASKPSGLPCCPHCGGVLFEVLREAEWWAGVDRHGASGDPGYRAFVEWLRGRCYPTAAEARAAHAAAVPAGEETT